MVKEDLSARRKASSPTKAAISFSTSSILRLREGERPRGRGRRTKRRFSRNVDNSRYRSSRRMQFYKPFRLRGVPPPLRRCNERVTLFSLSYSSPLRPFRLLSSLPISFCPRDLSTHLPSCPPFLSIVAFALLPGPPAAAGSLTQFCNFNLIFAHRYRPVQTAIMRADLIRLRCLSASAYFFRPVRHFRKNPRVAAL